MHVQIEMQCLNSRNHLFCGRSTESIKKSEESNAHLLFLLFVIIKNHSVVVIETGLGLVSDSDLT